MTEIFSDLDGEWEHYISIEFGTYYSIKRNQMTKICSFWDGEWEDSIKNE